MSQQRIGPEERLRVTLLFSAILHAIVILGVGSGRPRAAPDGTGE